MLPERDGVKRGSHRLINNTVAIPAIKLGAQNISAGLARRGVWLVVLMRVIAIIWIAAGLVHWADLLTDPTGDSFALLTPQRVAAVFFFCVLDFVAAIGLWLATPWGGVVWLVTVGAQVLSLVLLPGFWSHGTGLAIGDGALVSLYLGLGWYAAQDGGRKP